MCFALYLTYDNVFFNKFGWPIGIEPIEKNPLIKYYILENSWDDVDLFGDDIDEIANICNSTIGYGECDYFDVVKCSQLKDWIEKRLQSPTTSRYLEILSILKDYCLNAIKLNTGVYIDL